MMLVLTRLLAWLARHLVLFAVVLGVLVLVYLALRLPGLVEQRYESERAAAYERLEESRAVAERLAEAGARTRREMENNAERLRELERRREQLEGWLQTVRNLFRRNELNRERDEIERASQEARQSLARLRSETAALEGEHRAGREEIVARERELAEKERELERVRGFRETVDGLLRQDLRVLAAQAALVVLAVILIPFLWKLVAFYLLAPLVERAPPVRVARDAVATSGEWIEPPPSCSESSPAQRLRLGANEVLVTKERYLQSSTEETRKRTQWLLDWAYPFTSLASGLFLVTRIEPITDEPAADPSITLSCQTNATEELAILDVPPGGRVTFRPSHLAALVLPNGEPPAIHSRWVFFRLHSWLNFQFRHLTIEGPVKLVFAGQRGVQCEWVRSDLVGRRVNSHLTVAFSPQLRYGPRRAETFISYLRGANPLFDDFFRGNGVTIHQQVGPGAEGGLRRIWSGFFNAIGKAFGI